MKNDNCETAADGILPRDATLRNGCGVTLRAVVPADRALIEDGFAHLSQHSRFMRFLNLRQQLSAAELAQITDPDNHDNFALGAVTRKAGEPVGLARFVRLNPGGPRAEIAVTIADEYQHQGAGRLLLETLACIADNCGVRDFIALVHRENHAMQGLLKTYAWSHEQRTPDLEVTLPVSGVCSHARGGDG